MPVDPSQITALFLQQWGIPGAIIVVLGALNFMQGKMIIKLQNERLSEARERLADTKEQLSAVVRLNTESIQVMKDFKTTVDAVVAIVKAGRS